MGNSEPLLILARHTDTLQTFLTRDDCGASLFTLQHSFYYTIVVQQIKLKLCIFLFQEKEKELDGGTPENEKDATTEKEGKEGSEKENEEAPVTNGDAEDKPENGESTPPAEDGKKPKKEKVRDTSTTLAYY